MGLARSRRPVDYWPGFVDALSTLVLGIIFLLTVFVVVQFFLSQEVAGKETALSRLNAQIAQLTDLLSLEKTGKADIEEQLARLRASLSAAEGERDRLRDSASGASQSSAAAQQQLSQAASALASEKQLSARAVAQIDLLNEQITALRRQLTALEEALQASEKKGKDQQTQIANLGERLNVALAQRVQELTRYRSDFFGRLREILGNRPDIRVVGDRFVFQSEVLFDSGQAVLNPEGRTELDQLANALLELERQIPPEINWVLRVDGHTDVRPIANAQFPSNWALSAARAISVVQYLISKGVSPQHLVAAGFGEYQPLDPGRGRRVLPAQPAHRAQADGAVTAHLWLLSLTKLLNCGPTRRPTKRRRSRSGNAPGSRPTRTSILLRASAGGGRAGVTSWCRPRASSSLSATARWPDSSPSIPPAISIRLWSHPKHGAHLLRACFSTKPSVSPRSISNCWSIRITTAPSVSTRSTALR